MSIFAKPEPWVSDWIWRDSQASDPSDMTAPLLDQCRLQAQQIRDLRAELASLKVKAERESRAAETMRERFNEARRRRAS